MRASTIRGGFLLSWTALLAAPLSLSAAAESDPPHYVKKEAWQEAMLASRELLIRQEQAEQRTPLPNFGKSDFSVTAWIRTTAEGGTIVAKAPAEGEWAPQGKVLFLREGALAFDVGWVGVLESDTALNDGKWHHVALVGRDPLELHVDGVLVKRGRLKLEPDPPNHVAKIGYCVAGFPHPSGFRGLIDEVRIYGRRLSLDEVRRVRDGPAERDPGLVGYWRFEQDAADSSGNRNDGTIRGAAITDGKFGNALELGGKGGVRLPASVVGAAKNRLWDLLARDFGEPRARKEMLRERRDKIWDRDWRPGDLNELALRYVKACYDDEQRLKAAQLAKDVDSARKLWKVRAVYHAPPVLRLAEPTPLDKDPHLVGWWQLDQEFGSTAADSSKNGRDGTLAGGLSFDESSVKGRFGWALRFDGRGSFIEVPGYKGVSGTQPRTVAAWIKTKSSRGEIVSWGQDDFGRMWILGFVRGRVGVVPKGGYLYMNDALHDDTWHHVAAVVEEAEAPNLHDHVKLYKDGEPAAIHDIGLLDLWPLDTGEDMNLRIGRRFNGLIDEIRIYDRPLSEEEIRTLFDLKSQPE